MRRAVLTVKAVSFILSASLPLAAGELATRTLKLDHAATAALVVENLAGRMSVVAGQGDKLVAIATVHAETEALAAAFRFEAVRGEDGVETLRVRYPLDDSRSVRYPGSGGGSNWSWLGEGTVRTRYDGERVTVSGRRGVTMFADVEVQVPARKVEVSFRNAVGDMTASGVGGKLRFASNSGQVSLERLEGTIVAETGSGDIKAGDIEGSLRIATGSGDAALTGLKGGDLEVETGSGDVNVAQAVTGAARLSTGSGAISVSALESGDVSANTGSGDIDFKAVTARRVDADTGSGTIEAVGVDAEEFSADTGSGDVRMAAEGHRLARIDVDTGSGDVRLRLGPNAAFDALADQGSGDLVSHYSDATPVVKKRQVIGYRRGAGTTAVRVSTGSGDLVLEP